MRVEAERGLDQVVEAVRAAGLGERFTMGARFFEPEVDRPIVREFTVTNRKGEGIRIGDYPLERFREHFSGLRELVGVWYRQDGGVPAAESSAPPSAEQGPEKSNITPTRSRL